MDFEFASKKHYYDKHANVSYSYILIANSDSLNYLLVKHFFFFEKVKLSAVRYFISGFPGLKLISLSSHDVLSFLCESVF